MARIGNTEAPIFAIVFLAFLAAMFVAVGIDVHRVNTDCARDHGIVVKGGNYLHDTGLSGYVCVEKGMH